MSARETADGLRVVREGPVLRLILDRPEKRNALHDGMVSGLIAQLEAANQDEDVRVIVLTGAGEDFCAGFDLLARNRPSDPAEGAERAERRPRVGSIQRRLPLEVHRLIPLLLDVQTPVVCGVRGWAAGIGLHLAAAADFTVAARTARFWEPFAARGFTPDSGGTWLLPRLLGPVRAREVLLLGRELDGATASEWGLIHRAVDDDDVEASVEELVDTLSGAPTVAVGLTKWLIHSGATLDLDRHLDNEALALELSSRSHDFREGLDALREKRPPTFEGR